MENEIIYPQRKCKKLRETKRELESEFQHQPTNKSGTPLSRRKQVAIACGDWGRWSRKLELPYDCPDEY
jgi:hypothetical protein